MADSLLKTKLYIPTTQPHLVARPRLIEKLNEGLYRKLTLISAPAGFGKTTLITDWLTNFPLDANHKILRENKIAWLSLDENDNTLTQFLPYFIAALNQMAGVETLFGKETLSLLQTSQNIPIETILTPLINEIAEISFKIIMVLDDFHLIGSQLILKALKFLLFNLPNQLHLVIITREDPQLPLSKLRSKDQLTELRAADLRFSSSESVEFLNKAKGLNLSEEEVNSLDTRTEGWITGLQLAAISMKGSQDHAGFIESFTGSHRYILDYLLEEVLEQQSESMQTFLLKTAILKRLSGPLCDAITQESNGQSILETLEQANLFIISLDNEQRWYRYHHLFADLLRKRLQQIYPEIIPALHIQASDWHNQNKLFPEAIRHAFCAKDFDKAANLAELAWTPMYASSQSILWLDLVRDLPIEVIQLRPVLCAAFSMAFLLAGKLETAKVHLNNAEQWLEITDDMNDHPQIPISRRIVVDNEQFRALPITLATTRTYLSQALGDFPGTVKNAMRVLDLLPEGDNLDRGSINCLLGLAYWANGNLEKAHRTFSTGLIAMQKAGNDLSIISGAFVLAEIKITLGRLKEAEWELERALKLAEQQDKGYSLYVEDILIGRSELFRERGGLDSAADDLITGKKLGEQASVPDWKYRWCIAQARLKTTLGDLEEALELLEEAEKLYVRTPLPEIRPIAAMKARIWIVQGNVAKALAWVEEQGLSAEDELSYFHEYEHITLSRALIAQYREDREDISIQAGLGLLKRLLKRAEEEGRTGSQVEILILQALAYGAQDNKPRALLSLESALTKAEPQEYRHIFVDEGSPMSRLLYEILPCGIFPEYVHGLLSAFPADNPQAAPEQKHTTGSDYIEPLSQRELEVLYLIAEGLTNKEIASRLFLSLNTVKVHSRNIYAKLDAHHRAEAVAKARVLNILPSN
ncbi:MAG: hypothetical protein JEZ06_15800 [Anaerolineaceae bacterium]|nr:hypothetical protein [Anaerolineaceae bacterium]